MKKLFSVVFQGPFTPQRILGTARVKMVQVPKNRVWLIHLHFNFCPCQTIIFLRLVREPNPNIRSVSRITSTQYACVRCCLIKWRMESFRKIFSLIYLKSGDFRTEKLEQYLNVSIRWLSLLSGCSHYQDYYKLHYI